VDGNNGPVNDTYITEVPSLKARMCGDSGRNQIKLSSCNISELILENKSSSSSL